MQQTRQARTSARSERVSAAAGPIIRPLVAACLLLMLRPGHGGDLLTPERLAQEADVLVVVAVTLGPRGVEAGVEEILHAEQAAAVAMPVEETPLALVVGPCLPDRVMLAAWLDRRVGTPAARALWEHALSAGSYRAVLALRQTGAGLVPLCETETLLAEHWLGHPGHAAWRERLDAESAVAGDIPVMPAEIPPAAASGSGPDCPSHNPTGDAHAH